MNVVEIITTELEFINSQINSLKEDKLQIEARLIEALHHTKLGQKAYQINSTTKVTVTTKMNYRLDKSVYETIKDSLGNNVVHERIAYDLNKKMIEAFEMTNNGDAMREMAQYVSKAPAKPHVKISHDEGVEL